MNLFPLTIVTVDTVYFDGDAMSITCPGSEGELTVLRNHEPFVSVLKKGNVRVRDKEGKEKVFEIEKGILEVYRGGVAILL